MNQFIFLADWHLARAAWKGLRGAAGDSYAALEELVGYAIAHRLPIVAGGDLLDQTIQDTMPEGRERSLALTKLEECRMWAVKGIVFANHDGVNEIEGGARD